MERSVPGESEARKPKLLERARDLLRRRNDSFRTEEAYLGWIRRFILFHDKRHPAEMGATEVEVFLTHLAVDRNVASATQNQALSALLFPYKEVLETDLPWLDAVVRSRKPKRLPVVLSKEECQAIISHLDFPCRLVAELLYGAGLRLMEGLRLRVKDIDFATLQITVREGKGAKDRRTMLPVSVVPGLRLHLETVQQLHRDDLASGGGAVWLPNALDVKYPASPRQWMWQWVFPADSLSIDPRGGMQIDILTRRDRRDGQLLDRRRFADVLFSQGCHLGRINAEFTESHVLRLTLGALRPHRRGKNYGSKNPVA